MEADRIAARRLVVADKVLGLQRPQDVVGGAAMEAGNAGDLARIQRPLRAMQNAQHLCRRDNRAYRFARTALAEIADADPLSDRTGRLGFASLCLKGAKP